MTREQAKAGITSRHVAVAIMFGTAALIVLGLQPLLYTAYVLEDIIPGQRLGLLGAAELVSIALGSALSVHLLRSRPVWPIALAGVAVMVIANAVPVKAGEALALFGLRALAGAGAGLLVGLAASAIARTRRIGAWAGGYLFGQALSQYLLMRGFASFRPHAGSAEVQWTLGLSAAAVLLLLPLLPRTLKRAAADPPEAHPRPTPRGLIGLGAMFFCVGATGAVWGYLELWLHSRGVHQAEAAELLSVALLGQIIGAAGGAVIADGRLSWLRLLVLMAALAGTVGLWLDAPGSTLLAFGFGILFTLGAPAFTSILSLLDPEHRSVPYAATAQLGGIAVIPTIVGETLAAHDLNLLMIACIAFILGGVLLLMTQIPWFLRPHRAPRLI